MDNKGFVVENYILVYEVSDRYSVPSTSSVHVAFVSIDNIDESRPRCLTFDHYFQ